MLTEVSTLKNKRLIIVEKCLARKYKSVEQLMKRGKSRKEICFKSISVSRGFKVKKQMLDYLIEFCQNLWGVQSTDRTPSENARTKQKPFKIWKRKSFTEVLIAKRLSSQKPKINCCWFQNLFVYHTWQKTILFSRSIETLETNDAFKHNLDLKEFH